MTLQPSKLAMVPFVSVDNMMNLVEATGIEQFLTDLAGEIEHDNPTAVLLPEGASEFLPPA